MTAAPVEEPPALPSSTDPENAIESSRMSFGDHLEELRTRLIRALVGVAIACVGTLSFGEWILEWLFRPLWIVQRANGLQPNLQSLAPTDAFGAYMKMSFLAAFILAMPWILYQAWTFVASGLYSHERRFARRLTIASSGLFLVGVLFLYFLVLPVVLQFFISFNRAFEAKDLSPSFVHRLIGSAGNPPPPDVEPAARFNIPIRHDDPTDADPGDVWINSQTNRLVIRREDGEYSAPLEPHRVAPMVESQFAIPSYLSFVLMLALAFGVAFETPIVVCFLAWSGLMSSAAMRAYRRHIIFAIVVIAAVITPPDVVSQLTLCIPMYGLFELGLVAASMMERGRRTGQAGTTVH
ncbi:MAG: twin-arginine translocase subunit TatC [Planctomycetota bacterium]